MSDPSPRTSQQNADGTWSPAVPLGFQGGLDFEVSGSGPWAWAAYRGARLVASGRAKTRIGLLFATTRTRITKSGLFNSDTHAGDHRG